MDRIVVLGRGAGVLAPTLFASIVFSFVVGKTFLVNEKPVVQVSIWDNPSWWYRGRVASLVRTSLVAGVVFLIYSGVWHSGKLLLLPSNEGPPVNAGVLSDRGCSRQIVKIMTQKNDLAIWPEVVLPASVFIAGGILGGYLIYRRFSESLNAKGIQSKTDHYRFRSKFFIEGVLDRWILSGLTATYLMSVAAVVVLAYFQPFTLPYLWYKSTVAENQGSKIQGSESGEGAGVFLSRSGGYLYAISLPICENSSGIAYRKTAKSAETKEEKERLRKYYYRSIMAIPEKNVVDVELVDR